MQKRFPAASSATTTIARPYVQGMHTGKIHRRHRVAEEAVGDYRDGNDQQACLQRATSIPRAEQRTGNRGTEQVKCRTHHGPQRLEP